MDNSLVDPILQQYSTLDASTTNTAIAAATAAAAAAASTAQGSTPRQRISKACENCRLRRVKCTGEIPCQACKDSAIADTCEVRIKARPKRPLSAKIARRSTHDHTLYHEYQASDAGHASLPPPLHQRPSHEVSSTRFEDSLSLFDSVHHLAIPNAGSSSRSPLGTGKINPIKLIEKSIENWCVAHDVAVATVSFQDIPRLAQLTAAPLPPHPLIVPFEDSLIHSLVTAPDLGRLDSIDRSRLLNLYSRYRALPNSITDDQKALVLAALCIARHSQLRIDSASPMQGAEHMPREDVTYFRMSREVLGSWGRPSISAVWALFCLVSYCTAHGGLCEMKDLLEQMAWQIRELGLHKTATTALYPPQDMAQALSSAYFYTETFRASLSDLTPFIPLEDADPEVAFCPPMPFVPECLVRASNHAAAFMRDFSDIHLDMGSEEYLQRVEDEWSEALGALRARKTTGMERVKHGWAEIRYHWLRILLYFPLTLPPHPPHLVSLALVQLTRALSNILHIHTELSEMGKLDPSWPQYKRIVACGQVLVLVVSRKEVHEIEARELFARLGELLEGHRESWPVAAETGEGFRRAARKLGIHMPIDHPSTLSQPMEVGPAYQPVDSQEVPTWPGLFFDFDPGAFFGTGESAT